MGQSSYNIYNYNGLSLYYYNIYHYLITIISHHHL